MYTQPPEPILYLGIAELSFTKPHINAMATVPLMNAVLNFDIKYPLSEIVC